MLLQPQERLKREGPPRPAKGKPGHPLYGKVFPGSGPVKPPGVNDLPQERAKTFMPPGTSIWRGNKTQCWAAHVKPRKRHSAPWADFGGDSFLAMQAVVRRAWMYWLEDKDLPITDCPVPGLFPVAPVGWSWLCKGCLVAFTMLP